ncbi:CDP-diacylglycerol--glycerol-3-phosphate 3-phosphatidyltransferase [bacterium BMS3Abin03]|nr:CDP-diacylglycerol--glycerol-3-phosphate 3-phosphatidyltransferase [bacterium BMS3Abin03]
MKIEKKEFFTISNLLSFFRLLLAVPFWYLISNFDQPNFRYYTAGLAVVGAVTDWLDGVLARKFNQVTEVGKIIDPLADKITLGAIVIALYVTNEIPVYYFAFIIGRDIIIFLGGIYVSSKLGKVLPSNKLGKLTVSVIAVVLFMVVLMVDRGSIVFLSFYYFSIVLMFISLFAYMYRAYEYLQRKKNESV